MYKERMRKTLDLVGEMNLPTTRQRTKTILPLLQGEYMIKVAKNNKQLYYGDKHQYLGFLSFFVGLEFTKRKEAALFKKEELPQVIEHLNNLKGFKLVKIK